MKGSLPQGLCHLTNTVTPMHQSQEQSPYYVKHTLHADGFSIESLADYATAPNVRSQETVNNVCKFSQHWGLSINPKTEVAATFSLKTKDQDDTLTMNGQHLLTEEAPTFLRATLDKRLA
ncbi:hypothetical protein ElyMa_004531300 [Elysia marginata]|uniref:Uncharacterized protein n=1 Tax=Elysia marginata TaxID=1093978 RepID=A0AAV4HS15_9GAST|nr:hypothetical protein ElyMa_004531300 [Elysia marginata]